MKIGEALVRLGYLDAAAIETAFEAFLAEERRNATEDGTGGYAPPSDPVVAYLLEYFPKLVLRMGFLPAKLAAIGRPQTGPRFDLQTTLSLRGDAVFIMSWDASAPQGAGVAKGLLHLEDEDLTEEVIMDVMCELLNVAAGQIKRVAQEHGERLEIGLPETGSLPAGGLSFSLITPQGRGALVLSHGATE